MVFIKNVILSELHFVNMSFCHHAIWQAGLFAKEALFKLAFCQNDILSNWHSVKMMLCQHVIFVSITLCLLENYDMFQ